MALRPDPRAPDPIQDRRQRLRERRRAEWIVGVQVDTGGRVVRLD
jgi:hypothetical protein